MRVRTVTLMPHPSEEMCLNFSLLICAALSNAKKHAARPPCRVHRTMRLCRGRSCELAAMSTSKACGLAVMSTSKACGRCALQ
jgi:hypothetical protein